MALHYGWSAYWAGQATDSTAGAQETSPGEGDPNLRSANEVIKYAVMTSDGELGRLGDFVLEDANWFIRFLVVRAGSWFAGQDVLISTRWVGSISWSDRAIELPHSRDEL